jgi:FeS assembly protein IscX
MSKRKLKWSDTEDIAFLLIDKYPSTDANKLSLAEIGKRATALPQLAGTSKPSEEHLEAIQQSWFEERADMEDELGPLSDVDEGEDLDEDEYRSDRMIDDELSSPPFNDDDDDDEDEEELGDGFHEDEMSED